MEYQRGQLESVTTIFFDLDNTLIPTREGDELTCEEVVRLLCDQYSMPKNTATSVTRTFLENFRKCPHDTDFRIDEWRISLWKNALTEEYKGFAEEIYIMWLSLRYEYVAPGISVIKMLEQLRRKANYNLALITNGSSESQWEKIKLLNLSDYFDLILVSGDLPWEKPNANIFFKACELLGVKPAHCIMVGDKVETDINGAIFAGLNSTFLVKLKGHEVDKNFEFGGPDYILDTVLNLPSFLPRVNEPSCLLTRSRLFYAEEDSNSNYSNASDGS